MTRKPWVEFDHDQSLRALSFTTRVGTSRALLVTIERANQGAQREESPSRRTQGERGSRPTHSRPRQGKGPLGSSDKLRT
jgi:hypothetical protein